MGNELLVPVFLVNTIQSRTNAAKCSFMLTVFAKGALWAVMHLASVQDGKYIVWSDWSVLQIFLEEMDTI